MSSLIMGGAGLSIGASVVGKLPANAATAGIEKGFGAAGDFFPVMGTLGGANLAMGGLDNLTKYRRSKNG